MKMRNIDKKARDAASDDTLLNDFIEENYRFIRGLASRYSGRYITDNDDEWAVALEAFYEAVRTYVFEKGAFLSFAGMVISRRICDFQRRENRDRPEISIDPFIFSTEPEEIIDSEPVKSALIHKLNEEADRSRQQEALKDEIEAVAEVLKSYGITFLDLTTCAPRRDDTKKACIRAVDYLDQNPAISSELRAKKMLPIKIISKELGIPRKTLERHRKYIIAVFEISDGDYPYLGEYVR